MRRTVYTGPLQPAVPPAHQSFARDLRFHKKQNGLRVAQQRTSCCGCSGRVVCVKKAIRKAQVTHWGNSLRNKKQCVRTRRLCTQFHAEFCKYGRLQEKLSRTDAHPSGCADIGTFANRDRGPATEEPVLFFDQLESVSNTARACLYCTSTGQLLAAVYMMGQNKVQKKPVIVQIDMRPALGEGFL